MLIHKTYRTFRPLDEKTDEYDAMGMEAGLLFLFNKPSSMTCGNNSFYSREKYLESRPKCCNDYLPPNQVNGNK